MIELSAPLVANLIMAILSVAMLIQSTRLMRSVRQLRSSGLQDVVGAFDRATTEAKAVLTELRSTLAEDIHSNQLLIEKASELRDELEMMIEMGNATAERILTAAETSRTAAEAARLASLAEVARAERLRNAPPSSLLTPRKP